MRNEPRSLLARAARPLAKPAPDARRARPRIRGRPALRSHPACTRSKTMGRLSERVRAKGEPDNGRPVALGSFPADAPAPDQPTSSVGQFLSTGSGLLGGWSMAGLGGSFGSETWRDAELREERRALLRELRELRDRAVAAPPVRS